MAATEKHPASDAIVLEVRDLSAAPPGARVATIRNVTLELRRGEWLGITGPNGAGKTTLALALGGLWPPSGGSRRMGPGRDAEPRVVTVLQEPATQITQRSVREEVAFTALNLGLGAEASAAAAAEWADRLGLGGLMERAPHSLSAGQQQRVLLAAALAAAPDVVIADEAAAHFDPETRRVVLRTLRERVTAGLSLVWVSQDEEETEAADRVIEVTAEGRCQERAPHPLKVGVESFAARVESGPPTPAPPVEARPRVVVRISPHVARRIAVDRPMQIEFGAVGVRALVGPNGSGKTSLLEAIAGVESIEGVDVEWQGSHSDRPILAGQYPERQIFEERVWAEVGFAALRRGRSAAELEHDMKRMFDDIDLPERPPGRRTWELSIGEKRLVSLMSALLAPASIILLDEPTCGLDPRRKSVVGAWVRAASERVPVIVATQDRAWTREVGAIEVALGIRDGTPREICGSHAKFQQKNGLTEACRNA